MSGDVPISFGLELDTPVVGLTDITELRKKNIIIIIYPLPARVVGAPQMISHAISSIFLCSPQPFWDLANSRPVNSQILSSHLSLCLSCLLPPLTVPRETVLARPDERDRCPYRCSLRLFTMVRRSSSGPIAWHGLPRW